MRPSWDSYFMAIANLVATRATCDRKLVGAVLVRDHRILSTGYNGSVRHAPHCDSIGHDMQDGHCVATNHAESNAICEAARQGIRTDGATVYCNTRPCWGCTKLLIQAGIIEIVYQDEYGHDERVNPEHLKQLGVMLRRFLPDEA